MSGAVPLRGRALLLIGRVVLLDLLRRKDLYVLLFLMTIFALGALTIGVVGVENAATGTFLLNLGMTLAYYAAHALTLLLALGQLPGEIERRTLYPLLAKPVSRATLLVSKWAACTACGVLVLALLTLLGWLPAPARPTYHTGTLLQALLLLPFSLGLLAALALTLSLCLPRGVGLVLLGALVLAGGQPAALVQRLAEGSALAGPVAWLAAYVPDFSRLNLITRYTDGISPVAPHVLLGLLAYASLFGACALALGVRRFNRQAL